MIAWILAMIQLLVVVGACSVLWTTILSEEDHHE